MEYELQPARFYSFLDILESRIEVIIERRCVGVRAQKLGCTHLEIKRLEAELAGVLERL